jgi:circadian clock protein KaiC
LERLERDGALQIVWQPQAEYDIDQLGHRLLEAVSRRSARRVFIDGLDAFMVAAIEPERISRFLPMLATELIARGATVMSTLDKLDVAGLDVQVTVRGPSALTESVVLLGYVEQKNELVRLASVTKVRSSSFDHRIRTFQITERGLEIGKPWHGVNAK